MVPADLTSSCDWGITYCRSLDCHNKSWVANRKSCYMRWMFLDIKTIQLILPIRDLRTSSSRPHEVGQVRNFPMSHFRKLKSQSVCLPGSSLLQGRAAAWTCITDAETEGRMKGSTLKSVIWRMMVSKFMLTRIFMYARIHLSYSCVPARLPGSRVEQSAAGRGWSLSSRSWD